MQNNNPNNSWRSRLEDDTAFAGGEIINGDAAWDVLYNRLHKPRRKKAVWYWMAAAGIVAVVISQFTLPFPLQQKEITATKTMTEQKAIVNDIKPAPLNQNVAMPAKKNMAAPATATKKNAKQQVTEQPNKALAAIAIDTMEKITKEVVPAGVPGNKKEPANDQLATVQVKPTLKVVHVNELGGNTQTNTGRQGSDYSVLRIGANSKTMQPAGKIGIRISTAKTSPVN